MDAPLIDLKPIPIPKPSGIDGITISKYSKREELLEIDDYIKDLLSEPYNVYTYLYFIEDVPDFTFIARDQAGKMIGCVISKIERNGSVNNGYIGMVCVSEEYRGKKIGVALAIHSINAMIEKKCATVYLETEVDNVGAQRLYEALGFTKVERYPHYYLNGSDAFRMVLQLEGIFFDTPQLE
ncbi:hypothetical protein WA158_005300 [Blastocystis sp. Blastoise]